MGISAFAENQPEKVAYVMAQGQRQVTYGELEAAGNLVGAQINRGWDHWSAAVRHKGLAEDLD